MKSWSHQENAHIKKIRIEGHASSEGADAYNKTLDDAKAVMKYLVEHGIPQEALIAKATAKRNRSRTTPRKKARKRTAGRVHIIEQDVTKKKVESTRAQAKVLEERGEPQARRGPEEAPSPRRTRTRPRSPMPPRTRPRSPMPPRTRS